MSLDFEVDAPPIESLDELVDWFAAGEKPSTSLKVGVEHEKLPFRRADHGVVGYDDGIKPFLEGMQRFGWKPATEGPLVALKRDGESITLEPGGQVELAGAPRESLHASLDELHQHVREVNEVGDELGLGFAWLGIRPAERASDMPGVPKARYRFMADYLPTRGRRALDMMFLTATVQANFDFTSEADMVAKMRTAMRVSPAISALFGNSPYRHGAWDGHRSTRYAAWREVDPDRCGFLPFVFDEDFGYRRYLEWALDVPMLFFRREGKFIDLGARPFRRFFEEGFEGHRPNIGDFETHISLTFPEVRLKQFIEVRSVDCVPPNLAISAVALWKGLLYDEKARDGADQVFADLSVHELEALQFRAAQDGPKARVRSGTLKDRIGELLTLARGGLERLGHGEAPLLDPAVALFESGQTLSDRLVQTYGAEPARDRAIGRILDGARATV